MEESAWGDWAAAKGLKSCANWRRRRSILSGSQISPKHGLILINVAQFSFGEKTTGSHGRRPHGTHQPDETVDSSGILFS